MARRLTRVWILLCMIGFLLFGFHLWNLGRHEDLVIASCRGELGKVKRLVASGVDVNTTFGDLAWSPLECATSNRQYDVMEFLVHKGALSRTLGNNGSTPLKAARGDARALAILSKTKDFD